MQIKKEGEEINFHRNQFIVNNTIKITQESWLILLKTILLSY